MSKLTQLSRVGDFSAIGLRIAAYAIAYGPARLRTCA
jgi:hypothetical protein